MTGPDALTPDSLTPGPSPDPSTGSSFDKLRMTGEGSAAADERVGYRVGYGRPPVATRFRPGQSGNPRGRPRRSPTPSPLSAVAAAAGEPVDVKENGLVRRITKLEAAAKQLANRAAKGEDRAMKFLFDLLETYESRRVETDADRLGEADAAVIADLVRRIRASSP